MMASNTRPVWPLLILLALAVAAAATALQVRRARRLAFTKGALSLDPRIDWASGAGSASGLVLAGPSVAITGRLDLGEAHFA